MARDPPLGTDRAALPSLANPSVLRGSRGPKDRRGERQSSLHPLARIFLSGSPQEGPGLHSQPNWRKPTSAPRPPIVGCLRYAFRHAA